MAQIDELLSEIDDVARRIGIAAKPEWIREKLEEMSNRHKRWLSSGKTKVSHVVVPDNEIGENSRGECI